MPKPAGRFRRLIAIASIVALTFGVGTLTISQTALASQTVTATTAVNMRSGPATSYAVVAVIGAGKAVEASGTVTNGWYQVTSGGKTGWIYKTYLKAASSGSTSTTAPSTTAPAASGTATTTAAVNVRSGPGTTYAVLGVAAKGTTLSTTGTVSGGWTQVVYSGSAAWISTSYLTKSSATTPAITGQLKTTAELYLRTGGTLESPADGLLPANSIVDATGKTTAEYSEIVYGGKVRWIATRYTTAVTTTSPSVPGTPTATGTVYVTVGTLNVRATSAADGEIVGTVSRGAALPTTGVTTSDRTQVIYLNAARWVYTPYVSTSKPADSSLVIPSGITTSGMSQLNANAKVVVSHVIATYPKITTIYGWRASSDYSSDHPSGRAVDIMIPNWTQAAMADYGWVIAKDFAANAKKYRVNYVIYRQSIYNAAYPERGWRAMEDRGSNTANHYDHVHVSVFDN